MAKHECDILILHDEKELPKRYAGDILGLASKVEPVVKFESRSLFDTKGDQAQISCEKILCLLSDFASFDQDNPLLSKWVDGSLKPKGEDIKTRVMIIRELMVTQMTDVCPLYWNSDVDGWLVEVPTFQRLFLWWFHAADFIYERQKIQPTSLIFVCPGGALKDHDSTTAIMEQDFHSVTPFCDIVYADFSENEMVLEATDKPELLSMDKFRYNKINQLEAVLLVTSKHANVTDRMKAATTRVFSHSELLLGVLYVVAKCGRVALEIQGKEYRQPPPPIGPAVIDAGRKHLTWTVNDEHKDKDRKYSYSLQKKQQSYSERWTEVASDIDPCVPPYTLQDAICHTQYRLIAEDKDGNMSRPINCDVRGLSMIPKKSSPSSTCTLM